MARGRLVTTVQIVVALALAVPAVIGLLRADDGLTRTGTEIDGVPLTLLLPDGSEGDLPGVVVVHGFAGSSTIMDPLARVLARAGYAVVVPDLAGHGANSSPLDFDDTARDELQPDVATALDWLVSQPRVDSTRVALLGHSMGAGAVTRFAIEQPDRVQATVAISLPSAVEPVNIPRALLLMFGAAEPASFAEAAQDQYDAITAVDPAANTAVEVIPGVEHITIIWSPTTATSMLSWFGTAVDGPTQPVDLDPDWLWLILLLLAGCVAAIPLARLLFGRSTGAPEARVAGWSAMLITLAAALTATVISGLIGSLAETISPIAVAGYLVVWFSMAAGVIGLSMVWVRRYRRRSFGPPDARAIVASLAFTGYAVVLLIVTARLTWATSAFVGPRWWVWVILALALLGYFYADAVLVSRESLGARIGVMVVNRLILVAVLMAGALFLGAPGILTLLLPVMALLLVILGYFALVVSTRSPGRLGPALVQAVPLAAVIASGFPLT
jgi:dienelactone hydrolase